MITPASDRGLGTQSWEAARALDAEVLVIDQKDDRFPCHPDRFPGATLVRRGKGMDENRVRRFLETVDVVYSAETLFDPRMSQWCREQDTVSVVHVNPEFWSGRESYDRLWVATPWRLDNLPPVEVVPFPVATDRFTPVEHHEGHCRWLHVAGKRALADRNGTDAVMAALPLLQRPCSITIAVQLGDTPPIPDLPGHVSVEVVGPQADYWSVYENHDALVLPRRYGGLCLPVQEAMAAGLAVVMTDASPNRESWPVAVVPSWPYCRERMPAGMVPVAELSPRRLAREMDRFADPLIRRVWQERSKLWAEQNSWVVQAPRWMERFDAFGLRPSPSRV